MERVLRGRFFTRPLSEAFSHSLDPLPPLAASESGRSLHRAAARAAGNAPSCKRIPAAHSITRSARRITVCGITMPSDRAVFMLTHRTSNVGCSTGKSAGFAPARIFLT
jgi:hypothetical protein